MLRGLSATPCPVSDSQRNEGRRDSLLSTNCDTTTNLEYTTDFKSLFRNTKPRRRPTAIAKSNGVGPSFTIHEDEELNLDVSRHHRNGGRTSVELLASRRSSMAQPPQRPRHRVSFAQPQVKEEVAPAISTSLATFSKAPRRVSFRASTCAMPPSFPDDETLPRVPSPKISKPARRGTIYIPTDDTTMPSMYMGLFSPLKHSTTEVKQDDMLEMTGLAATMAKKKASRKSILAASPKRAALVPHKKPLQASLHSEDREGQGPGKENLPPGYASSVQNVATQKTRQSMLSVCEAPQREFTSQRPLSRLFDQTTSSLARLKDQDMTLKSNNRRAWNSGARLTRPCPIVSKPEPMPGKSADAKQMTGDCRVPTRFVIPKVPTGPTLDRYPLLPEGVPDVSMYEENWLTQQEVAITQLVNTLFEASSPTFGQSCDYVLLRLKLLELYGSPEMGLVYKRLQGALLYGSLSVSTYAVEHGFRLNSDLGHRRAFVNLWLQTYDHQVLRTAFEVIVGRLVGCKADQVDAHTQAESPSTVSDRVLHRAIETFLIRNEDGNADSQASDTVFWAFQRTVLRSLLLIKLLDLVKTRDDVPPTSSLFQPNSEYKTSASVVQRLFQMVSPGVGDPLRHLGHLGYTVDHCQYPLEEYNYEIRNLAVDLRDGVRITRLVELLLYRSASQLLGHIQDVDATTTLALPTGEVLSLTNSHQDWPLSQHLKFPCLSRAAKIFNNQIALSALQGVKGVNGLFHDISAEDIVNGYREKTVRFLWVLTSKWGLGGLVDWEDLKREIRRLGRSRGRVGNWYVDELDFDEEESGYMQYKSLLKAWVKAVAGAHGLFVRNFTTSFADGKIFEAIVNEYQPYLGGLDAVDPKCRLPRRLKDLGCSEQFVRLFETTPGGGNEHIFDREFVLASLAFLCSRLLGPSKRARAAVAIQRGWRVHWGGVLEKRKAVLRLLAASCAAEVQRNNVRRRAKARIWRNWRAFKARKQGQVQTQARCEAALARAVSNFSLDDNSGEDEDIWLSLR